MGALMESAAKTLDDSLRPKVKGSRAGGELIANERRGGQKLFAAEEGLDNVFATDAFGLRLKVKH
jgi:hypothetical protein